MSNRTSQERIGETKNKKPKKELTVDEAKTEIVNKIVTEMDELLDDQSGKRNISTNFRRILRVNWEKQR